MTDLELSTNGERIVWRGKPRFNCFVLETVFNSMLFFALIWGAFDILCMKFAFSEADAVAGTNKLIIGLFFLFHMMPVWIYLGGIITSIIRYKNTEYIITERGVYISGGVLAINIRMKPFTDLSHINIHKGVLDQLLGVGDVVMVCEHSAMPYQSTRNHNHANEAFNICDIEDYQRVFKILKEMQTDIYSDTMYPNAKRPDNNPGYKTTYNKF